MKRNPYRKSVCFLTAVAVFAPLSSRAQAPAYAISTVVGTATNGYSGDGGLATQADLSNPCGLAVDSAGNLYIADQSNARIRKVAAGVINTIAGNGTNGYTGDGKPPTQANISLPCGVAVDPSGNVYFSQTDAPNSAVRKAPATGNMSTVTGTAAGGGFSGDGAVATSAQVNGPMALALDSSGNLYVLDTLNNRVRVITSDGKINTVVGNGFPQYSGDGGSPTSASLNNPQGIALDSAGNLYIADTFNNRIRKVSGNVITTIAGIGTSGFSGDGGPAVNAQLNFPKGVAVDAAGNVYIVDSYNWRIRVVTPSGIIFTIAGRSAAGYSGDGGPATSARLNFPEAIALGPNGTLYFSDTQNNVIRLLTPGTAPTGPPTIPPTITSIVSASACGNFSSVAPGAWMEIHGAALAAGTRPSGPGDFNGINAPTSLDGTQVSMGGQNAVLSYISPTQVNAQVPLNISPGDQQVTVVAANGTSAPFTITVNAAQPGLCQGLQVGGNQYVGATINGTATVVLPAGANVAGVTSRPAHPGEVITIFGNGFGAVTPSATQGQLVQQPNQLTDSFEIFFGQTQGAVQYAGLAPGYIGMYQINVVVPNIPDSDAVPVTFALGNFAGAPTLYTAVKQ